MGKLVDLRKEHEECNDEARLLDIEAEINRIEQWCIDNIADYNRPLTVFRVEVGTEDPCKCAICQVKGRAPYKCEQTLYNGKVRKICPNCKLELDRGMLIYANRRKRNN